jgi:hypothetical protein
MLVGATIRFDDRPAGGTEVCLDLPTEGVG